MDDNIANQNLYGKTDKHDKGMSNDFSLRLSQYRSVAICLFASLMFATGVLQVLVGYIVIH
jgi:hypothetical protein